MHWFIPFTLSATHLPTLLSLKTWFRYSRCNWSFLSWNSFCGFFAGFFWDSMGWIGNLRFVFGLPSLVIQILDFKLDFFSGNWLWPVSFFESLRSFSCGFGSLSWGRAWHFLGCEFVHVKFHNILNKFIRLLLTLKRLGVNNILLLKIPQKLLQGLNHLLITLITKFLPFCLVRRLDELTHIVYNMLFRCSRAQLLSFFSRFDYF